MTISTCPTKTSIVIGLTRLERPRLGSHRQENPCRRSGRRSQGAPARQQRMAHRRRCLPRADGPRPGVLKGQGSSASVLRSPCEYIATAPYPAIPGYGGVTVELAVGTKHLSLSFPKGRDSRRAVLGEKSLVFVEAHPVLDITGSPEHRLVNGRPGHQTAWETTGVKSGGYGSDGTRTRDLRRDRSDLEDHADSQIRLFDAE